MRKRAWSGAAYDPLITKSGPVNGAAGAIAPLALQDLAPSM
jgi:hypothetical protein